MSKVAVLPQHLQMGKWQSQAILSGVNTLYITEMKTYTPLHNRSLSVFEFV